NDPMVLTKVLGEQLMKLMRVPLQELKPSLSHPMVIVIDSLDECDGKLASELVLLLSELVRDCHFLRIFITSREEPHIRSRFADANVATVTHRRALRAFDANSDIRLFFERTFAELAAHCRCNMHVPPNPWPSASALECLVNQASGLFI
ncbi:hypothetical protein BJ138DRAFT_968462, partial [Hygrophoropsis aurantiaca]